MKTRYFNNPQTLEELKKQYRELTKTHHPDNGGDTAIMQAVNGEYSQLSPDIHQTKDGETYTSKQENTETAEQFIDLINELMKMDNISIEIIGCFVWVTGETKPYKEILKGLKFQWHSKKIAWYLKPEDYKRKSRKDYGLDEIRAMYGTSGAMNSNSTKKIEGRTSA